MCLYVNKLNNNQQCHGFFVRVDKRSGTTLPEKNKHKQEKKKTLN